MQKAKRVPRNLHKKREVPQMKHLLTTETALHAAGIGVTALAAHSAVTYLQTYAPDEYTALGYSLCISLAVFLGWAYTLKTRGWLLLPLISFSLIITAVSGYTVYQSGLMPLQQAAITEAANKDQPRQAEHQRQVDRYNQLSANLKAQIDDLRAQNTAIAADKQSTEGKGANWRKDQLQKKLDANNAKIADLSTQQAALSPPGEFSTSAPSELPADQKLPILARAFAFELIAVMFMVFAALSRKERDQQETRQASCLTSLMQQAETSIRQLETLFRHAEKCRNDVGIDVGITSECSIEEKTPEHLYFLLKNRLIQPNKNGNFPTDWIMEKANVGERKAKQLADDWCNERIIERIKSGRGYTYRYPETTTSNVIQLRTRNEH